MPPSISVGSPVALRVSSTSSVPVPSTVPIVTLPLVLVMPTLVLPCKVSVPAELIASAPEVVVDTVSGPLVTFMVRPPVLGPVMVRAVVPLKVRLPPCVNVPAPVVMAPLFVVCRESVLLPMSQVEAAAPPMLTAPAEVTDNVPEVVVDTVSGPLATVTARPPVLGPVSVRAAVPLNVTLPPCVKVPVPVVMAPLLAVWIESVFAPMSHVEAAAPVRLSAPADVTARVPEVVVRNVSGPVPTVTVKPPVLGPVIVWAAVPLNVSPAPKVVRPPDTVNVLVPVMVVLPFILVVPVVVSKVPLPLKSILGLLVILPMVIALTLVPATPIFMPATPPASKLSALAPLL